MRVTGMINQISSSCLLLILFYLIGKIGMTRELKYMEHVVKMTVPQKTITEDVWEEKEGGKYVN